jgi:dolichyl-phosphate beta-glucosyltransferase
MHEVIIVVPCYNEAKRLDLPAFRDFASDHPWASFLFVNDGSTDLTSEVLKELCGSNRTCFSVYDLPRNVGKAEAVRTGVLKALEFKPKYVGMWDADLATPLGEIPRFCRVLNDLPQVRMVFGARVRLMGRTIERPGARHYMGRLAATVISWTVRLPIYDTQCGAKIFRATEELADLFHQPFLSSWIFDVEILARLIAANNGVVPADAIYELPLDEWKHKGGSRIRAGDYFKALWELFLIRRNYL